MYFLDHYSDHVVLLMVTFQIIYRYEDIIPAKKYNLVKACSQTVAELATRLELFEIVREFGQLIQLMASMYRSMIHQDWKITIKREVLKRHTEDDINNYKADLLRISENEVDTATLNKEFMLTDAYFIDEWTDLTQDETERFSTLLSKLSRNKLVADHFDYWIKYGTNKSNKNRYTLIWIFLLIAI